MKKEKITYISESPAQTKRSGFLLAKTILGSGSRSSAVVLALRGDLGAGKTNFIQGFAKGLGVEATINSPTFVILKKYPLKTSGEFKIFYHIDCYRLGSAADLAQLGIENVLDESANIVAIEWPEIAKDALREIFLNINIIVVGGKRRHITITPN